MPSGAFWKEQPERPEQAMTAQSYVAEHARLTTKINQLEQKRRQAEDRTRIVKDLIQLIDQLPKLSPRAVPRVRERLQVDAQDQAQVSQADLFWVTEPMKALVDAAVEDVPHMVLHPSMAPSPCGVLLTPDSVGDFSFIWNAMRGRLVEDMTFGVSRRDDDFMRWILSSDRPPSFQGFWWYWREDGLKLGYLAHLNSVFETMISSYTGAAARSIPTEVIKNVEATMRKAHRDMGPMVSMTELTLSLDSAQWDESLRPLTSWIITCWLLMTQGGLAQTSSFEHGAKERKKALKAQRPLPDIRLISLRSGSQPSDSAGPGHKLVHRFAVRGHWRNQAWGPGRQLRRPVYIAPFLKGPEGAPLLEGTKVHVWRS